MKVSHPVRSAVNKYRIAWLVLPWVTMWESQVLNSLLFLILFLALSVSAAGAGRGSYYYDFSGLRSSRKRHLYSTFLDLPVYYQNFKSIGSRS